MIKVHKSISHKAQGRSKREKEEKQNTENRRQRAENMRVDKDGGFGYFNFEYIAKMVG